MKKRIIVVCIFISLLVFQSCALDRFVVDGLSGSVDTKQMSVFMQETDTELVADAFPSFLKLQELLLSKSPKNKNLLLATGSSYVMYANAFVQAEANRLDDTEYDKKNSLYQRSIQLYLKAWTFLSRAVEKTYPGFDKAFRANDLGLFLGKMKKKDVGLFYWYTAAWLSLLSLDNVNLDYSFEIPSLKLILDRCLQLDRNHENGSLLSLAFLLYSGLPDYLGGDLELAGVFLQEALSVSKAGRANLYIEAAKVYGIQLQDVDAFNEYLDQVWTLKLKDFPDEALILVLAQKEADWLKKHQSDFFY